MLLRKKGFCHQMKNQGPAAMPGTQALFFRCEAELDQTFS
jgi:hypothetical protein